MKKRLLGAIFALLLLGSSLCFAEERLIPIYCVQRDDSRVALTFDAAWGNEDTEELIDILGRYGAKATFFVVGDWARKYPESVKALFDAGHEVMNHSDTHPHMNSLSAEGVISEAEACSKAVEAVTGVKPDLIRVPYGEYNNTVVSALNSIGMKVIQWDVDSLDWKDPAPAEIVRRVTGKMASGSICLFHNAAKNTPAALPDILEYMKREGFEAVTVSELLLEGEYSINHEGRMIPQ